MVLVKKKISRFSVRSNLGDVNQTKPT
uniref:Uncharacterized protein n=1 Tax=Arundo donax TaxID=35708 RepID=A0A0A8ZIQ3_ARUDO